MLNGDIDLSQSVLNRDIDLSKSVRSLFQTGSTYFSLYSWTNSITQEMREENINCLSKGSHQSWGRVLKVVKSVKRFCNLWVFNIATKSTYKCGV